MVPSIWRRSSAGEKFTGTLFELYDIAAAEAGVFIHGLIKRGCECVRLNPPFALWRKTRVRYEMNVRLLLIRRCA